MTTLTHLSHETTRLFGAPAPLFLALQGDGDLRADENTMIEVAPLNVPGHVAVDDGADNGDVAVYVADDGDAASLHIEDARFALVNSLVFDRLPRGKTPQHPDTPDMLADTGGQTLGVVLRDMPSTRTSVWRDVSAIFGENSTGWGERADEKDSPMSALTQKAMRAFMREISRRYIIADRRLLKFEYAKAALDEALADLADLDDYAKEKSLPPPAPLAKESAQEFLRKVVREVPRCYAVSPWDGGKVVVHTRGAKGFGVGVYFNAEGGASCYVTRPGVEGNEEHHYSRLSGFPNEFILAALRELGE